MKCLNKFQWVKLPREHIPVLKGKMGYWIKLASRAAFRKGTAIYCGYENDVEPGMWAGGIVGLKSILGARSRQKALQVLDELQALGYLTYELEQDTKKLTYQITDWVVKCTGKPCEIGTVYPDAGKLVREGLMEEIPVELGFTREGWFCLRMPILLPRKEKTSRNYIRGYLYPALERFVREKGWIRYPDCVLIFRHVYDRKRPERDYRDHDNIELNTVVDAVSMFLLIDDTPMRCRHYYCSAAATNERTEVYIVPRDDFPQWLAMEKDIPDAGVFLHGEMPKTRKKDS